MQKSTKSDSARVPSLAVVLFILCVTWKHLEASKVITYEPQHDHDDHDEPQIKCSHHAHMSEPEPFDQHMSDMLQDTKHGSDYNNNNNNNLKPVNKWRMISNQLNGMWPDIMKHMDWQEEPAKPHQHEHFSKMVEKQLEQSSLGGGTNHMMAKQEFKGDQFTGKMWKRSKFGSYFPAGQNVLEKHKPVTTYQNIIDSSVKQQQEHEVTLEPQKGTKFDSIKQQQEVLGDKGFDRSSVKDVQLNQVMIPSEVKKHDGSNELDQQDQAKWTEPIMLHSVDEQLVKTQQASTEENVGQSHDKHERSWSDQAEVSEPSNSQNARNSLLKAADVARRLNGRYQSPANVSLGSGSNQSSGFEFDNPSGAEMPADFAVTTARSETENRNLNLQTEPDLSSTNNYNETKPATTRSPATESNWENILNDGSNTKPKYLGLGDYRKNEPLNGRIQARLSCQFGDESQSNNNMTISDVEWARFVGPYEQEKATFECQDTFCRLIPVRTDTVTTIHPRPASQSYINSQAQSYSITLHEVDDRHVGVYRCSAVRQVGNGKSEIVYRIIPFE